jgi:hypothetical protein
MVWFLLHFNSAANKVLSLKDKDCLYEFYKYLVLQIIEVFIVKLFFYD